MLRLMSRPMSRLLAAAFATMRWAVARCSDGEGEDERETVHTVLGLRTVDEITSPGRRL